MILLLIHIVAVIVGTWLFFKLAKRCRWRSEEIYVPLFLIGILILLLSIIMVPWYFKLTTGFMPTYSEGERIGYVTKLTAKGIFWKTWEGEMQMGTGELASLQEHFHFSVYDSVSWS